MEYIVGARLISNADYYKAIDYQQKKRKKYYKN